MKRGLKRLLYQNKIKLICYIITFILLITSSILLTISLVRLNNIETFLRIIILFLVYLFVLLFIYKGYKYIVNKNKVKYIILDIVTIIISVIFLILTYYINIVYGTIGLLANRSSSYYTGYLIKLKDTEEIKKVGIISNEDDIEGYVVAKDIIKDNKLNYELVNYDDYENIIDDLYKKTLDGAFVQSSYINYFNSDDLYPTIAQDTSIVYKKTITKKNKVVVNKNSKLDKPFTILLMGVDSTLNNIETMNSFNGDTLMLITFNPQTLNATMFSIPRDLYVPIACKKNASAKINTSSVGGIECVEETIKNLIGIDIDYYAKINFKGVVDLVNALHGIDVMVTYPFCEQDSNRDFTHQICLEKGYQHLNGEQALAYARHRHTLPTGDLQRIQNQQLIVEAMAKKLLSLNTITDFKDIMDAIGNNVSTNLSVNEILSSYNILKQMLLNSLADKDSVVVEKAYLEVYDKNIYNEKKGTYSQALGYYENSLNSIIKHLKVNLGIEEPTVNKEFTFDANTPYEQQLVGKGDKNTIDNPTVPNFVGKDISFAEKWGRENNITINKVMVDNIDSHFNSNVALGLIASQSIKSGTSLVNVKSLTVYINTINENAEEDNNDSNDDTTSDNDEVLENELGDIFDIN